MRTCYSKKLVNVILSISCHERRLPVNTGIRMTLLTSTFANMMIVYMASKVAYCRITLPTIQVSATG